MYKIIKKTTPKKSAITVRTLEKRAKKRKMDAWNDENISLEYHNLFSPADLRVLQVLMRQKLNYPTKSIQLCYRHMCAMAFCSDKTAQATIKKAEALNIIYVKRVRQSQTRNDINQYGFIDKGLFALVYQKSSADKVASGSGKITSARSKKVAPGTTGKVETGEKIDRPTEQRKSEENRQFQQSDFIEKNLPDRGKEVIPSSDNILLSNNVSRVSRNRMADNLALSAQDSHTTTPPRPQRGSDDLRYMDKQEPSPQQAFTARKALQGLIQSKIEAVFFQRSMKICKDVWFLRSGENVSLDELFNYVDSIIDPQFAPNFLTLAKKIDDEIFVASIFETMLKQRFNTKKPILNAGAYLTGILRSQRAQPIQSIKSFINFN